MYYFLKKTLLFLICPFLGLYIGGLKLQAELDNRIKNSNLSSEYKEWNEILNGKVNADIIIQGSSRAWVQFDPYVIDSAFKINSYNLGMAAYPFDAQYCRFKCYKHANKNPRVIIQCVDYNLFSKSKYLFGINQFIPYMENENIRGFLKETGELSYIDFNLPIYKYRWLQGNSSCLLSSFWSAVRYSESTAKTNVIAVKYKGFKAQDKHWGDEKLELNSERDIRTWKEKYFDNRALKYFDDFVKYCQRNKIQLILVYPPEYFAIKTRIGDYRLILDELGNIAKSYNLPFLDYSGNKISSDTAFFYDYRHLNKSGVQIFNQMLVRDLAGCLKF